MAEGYVQQTGIPGLVTLNLRMEEDQQGWFLEGWHAGRLAEHGVTGFTPVQLNARHFNHRGLTAGFYAEPWDRVTAVVEGRVMGAWVDLRPGPGYGRTATAELERGQAVFIPRGVGNAHQVLDNHTTLVTMLDQHWTPEARSRYVTVNLFDPSLAIRWPIGLEEAIVSDADLRIPPLAAIPGAGPRRGIAEAEPTEENRPFRVLFVCTANICRSAYADVAANAVAPEGLQFSSAGVRALVGEGIDPPMAQQLADGGPAGAHRARQLTRALVEEADLVLTMAGEHRRYILDEWPALGRKTFVIGHAARVLAALPEGMSRQGVVEHLWRNRTVQDGDEVADPYRRGDEAARVAARKIDGYVAVIVEALSRR
ncbi:dTDP-4-dehydrorhamnose 3,5-epimerase family protein [Tessaracoccus lapidicaptus]|uniref:dTDP-4-dehydrorhamnose 3,5-epimerase family protein n=1 Tax=Tessaracoccus lapidicaptus TaxID=1427523 RepID=UPI00333E372A